MTAAAPDNTLDERYHEVARLQARADRAEAAIGRVLELCKSAVEVQVGSRAVLPVSDVRAAIAGTR